VTGEVRAAAGSDSDASAPKPRIACVVAEFPSLSETFVLREILSLRDLGYDVEVFSLRRPAHRKCHAGAAALRETARYARPSSLRRAVWSHAHFMVRSTAAYFGLLPAAIARFWPSPVCLLRAVRRIPAAVCLAGEARRWGATHVHAQFAHVTADVAAMMARLLGVPWSVSAHARDIYASPGRILRRRLRDAAFVVTCTAYNLDHLRRVVSGPESERLHLVYHGVNVGDFPSGDARGGLILAVGRLVPKKGFVHLLDACRLLRERGVAFRCVIVGDGAQREMLAERISRSNLKGAVYLSEGATQEEMAPLFRVAALLAAPSVAARSGDRDALPNVILEAMASGLPVVASRVAGIPEAVEDSATGLLTEPGDAEALAAAMQKLLSDKRLRAAMGRRGRERAMERFDARRNAEPLGRLFEGAAKAARPGGREHAARRRPGELKA
jgi:glycosyltransferase involved in cell wall biosynthesis